MRNSAMLPDYSGERGYRYDGRRTGLSGPVAARFARRPGRSDRATARTAKKTEQVEPRLFAVYVK